MYHQTISLNSLNGRPIYCEQGGTEDMQTGFAVICTAPDGSPMRPITQEGNLTAFEVVEDMVIIDMDWDRAKSLQGRKYTFYRVVNVRGDGTNYLADLYPFIRRDYSSDKLVRIPDRFKEAFRAAEEKCSCHQCSGTHYCNQFADVICCGNWYEDHAAGEWETMQ